LMKEIVMLDISTDFKEQRTEARRRQILMGAAQVFAEKGFHKATTKEIAQVAGVSEGTIYNYFNDKRELLLAMIELIATQSLKSIIADHPPADPKEFFTMLMRDRYQLAHERGYLMAPIMAEIFANPDLRKEVYNQIALPLASHLEQYIQAQIDSGHFRPVNPLIVTRALVGAIMLNFAIKLSEVDSRYEAIPAEAMIEQLVSLFVNGLLAPMSRNDP
jgi:AcrR family transcriptional regulator